MFSNKIHSEWIDAPRGSRGENGKGKFMDKISRFDAFYYTRSVTAVVNTYGTEIHSTVYFGWINFQRFDIRLMLKKYLNINKFVRYSLCEKKIIKQKNDTSSLMHFRPCLSSPIDFSLSLVSIRSTFYLLSKRKNISRNLFELSEIQKNDVIIMYISSIVW